MRRMPFEPAFMRDLDTFHRELAQVRSLPEWARFKGRWFADMPWPRRSPEQIAALEATPTVQVNGRTFHRGVMLDDVTPHARYEYMAAMQVAFGVLFPGADEQPGGGGSGVRHACPACELWTDDPGDAACPQCGRALLRLRTMGKPA